MFNIEIGWKRIVFFYNGIVSYYKKEWGWFLYINMFLEYVIKEKKI